MQTRTILAEQVQMFPAVLDEYGIKDNSLIVYSSGIVIFFHSVVAIFHVGQRQTYALVFVSLGRWEEGGMFYSNLCSTASTLPNVSV